jgi:hypothetical protein
MPDMPAESPGERRGVPYRGSLHASAFWLRYPSGFVASAASGQIARVRVGYPTRVAPRRPVPRVKFVAIDDLFTALIPWAWRVVRVDHPPLPGWLQNLGPGRSASHAMESMAAWDAVSAARQMMTR